MKKIRRKHVWAIVLVLTCVISICLRNFNSAGESYIFDYNTVTHKVITHRKKIVPETNFRGNILVDKNGFILTDTITLPDTALFSF
ncbi:MAG: hypothetical protein LBS01_02935 [Prevotellaceae bacterium]|jgi:hypothetical protein|nr:hypothetical protein [Prevotellaceae bacterium]